MRNLPRKRNEKQNLIIEATNDFFGDQTPEEKKSAVKIALWIMNRRKGNVLSSEEVSIVGKIKANLSDPEYVSSFGIEPSPECSVACF